MYDSAHGRWAGVGPYYAMFPVAFADATILMYSNSGDVVLDPFAGRGTAVFSAAIHKRMGIGIEINPVGWVYGKAKLHPAEQKSVENRIEEIALLASRYVSQARAMPEFFRVCFCSKIRAFLLSARDNLDWRRNAVDWTTMAFLLIYLHGKTSSALSNQMRQTKSMSPKYALKWWKARHSEPPKLDPVAFLTKRIQWRYAKGRPQSKGSQVYLGDCTSVLRKFRHDGIAFSKPRLLLTSPPYYGVTNYHYDQWLRLWLLGSSGIPYVSRGKHKGRFENRQEYRDLIHEAFSSSAPLLSDDAVIYVRIDGRPFTCETTLAVLKEVFPNKTLVKKRQPFKRPTQTHLFANKTDSEGEVDLILTP